MTWLAIVCLLCIGISAPERLYAADLSSAERGYENLREHPYLPPDFDEAVFSELWTVWPEPERTAAKGADTLTRRKLTFSHYGLMPSPEDHEGTKPALGYVGDQNGNWSMNCLACHGGKVAGRVIPGLPNSHIALQTLAEDVLTIKIRQAKPLSHLDLGSLQTPLGTSNGTTNAVMFGVILGAYRRPDMTVDLKRKLPTMVHHDVDAPPFWNVRKKRALYVDGFAPKTARPLMQFIMLPRVSPAQLNQWEPEFAEILSWIESLEPPPYPYEIDRELASKGEAVFNKNCSSCHGTYGSKGQYNQRTIPLDEVGTDPVRLKALTREHRQLMKDGWISRYGKDSVDTDPEGYIAPPLDGIWASAPYFHNGSVPTLWHLLHPDSRPIVWKRTEDGYDRNQVGLEFESLVEIPVTERAPAHRRRYFDTTKPGKSAQGHGFPDVLTEEQKQAVLEYLKSI